MGYETKLIIGRKSTGGGKTYFLIDVEIELSKCGGTGYLPELIEKVLDQENKGNYEEVYYSETFQINREKVYPKLEELGVESNVIDKIFDECESWEDETHEDSYGEPLRAVPTVEVYEALTKQMAQNLLDGELPYRRYLMAESVLKITMETFRESFVILYGH